MNYRIERFLPAEWSEAALRKTYNFRQVYFTQKRPSAKMTYEAWHTMVHSRFTSSVVHSGYIIFHGEKVEGMLMVPVLQAGMEGEHQQFNFLLSEAFWEGDYAPFIESVLNKMKVLRPKTMTTLEDERLKPIAARCGFRTGNEIIHLDLNKSNLNRSLVDSILKHNPLELANLSWRIFKEPTRADYVKLADLATILLNDMRRDDRHHTFKETPEHLKELDDKIREDKAMVWYLVLCDNTGRFVGMSALRHNMKMPKQGDQFMTGVLAEYRGKGLAKWLKAYLYDFLFREYPSLKLIQTDCFAANAPILGINQQFGFVEQKREINMVFVCETAVCE